MDRFEILKEIEDWEKELDRLEDSEEDESEEIEVIKDRINTLKNALDDAE